MKNAEWVGIDLGVVVSTEVAALVATGLIAPVARKVCIRFDECWVTVARICFAKFRAVARRALQQAYGDRTLQLPRAVRMFKGVAANTAHMTKPNIIRANRSLQVLAVFVWRFEVSKSVCRGGGG